MNVHAFETGRVAVRTRQRQGVGRGTFRFLNTLLDPNWTEPLPIYAWLIDHPEGLILVDTGETARVDEPGYFPRWHPYYRRGVRAWVEPEDEIGPQLERLGVAPSDIRWVVLTHLHTDHAGGLHHLPANEVLVSSAELDAAAGVLGRLRGYLNHRWPVTFAPTRLRFEPEPMGPFDRSHRLTAAGDVVIVPTPGHSPGHMSVIVDEGERALFLAGDTSYTEDLMRERAVDGVCPDDEAARLTLERINDWVEQQPTVYLPSHDTESGSRLADRAVVAHRRASRREPRVAVASRTGASHQRS